FGSFRRGGSSGSIARAGCTTASATGGTTAGGSSSGSTRDERPAQLREALVPARTHVDHPGDSVAERLWGQLVARLAAGPRRAQQSGVRKRGELLRDCLPRHRQAGGELRRRRAAARCDRLDERAARGIAERVEDEVYATAAHASAC